MPKKNFFWTGFCVLEFYKLSDNNCVDLQKEQVHNIVCNSIYQCCLSYFHTPLSTSPFASPSLFCPSPHSHFSPRLSPSSSPSSPPLPSLFLLSPALLFLSFLLLPPPPSTPFPLYSPPPSTPLPLSLSFFYIVALPCLYLGVLYPLLMPHGSVLLTNNCPPTYKNH